MSALRIAAAALAALVCCPVLCTAEPSIDIRFQDGHVCIDAADVTVRDVLREWVRLGGTRIVNGDLVEGPPMTLHLTDVAEEEALDTLLRGSSGYFSALHEAGAGGPSRFRLIVLLPMTPAVDAAAVPTTPRGGEERKPSNYGLPEPLADIIRAVNAGQR